MTGPRLLSAEQREWLEATIEELDAEWDRDAKRGLCDERGGAEYQRRSIAPVLRAVVEQNDG